MTSPSHSGQRINQLAPFNAHRFKACMAYMGRKLNRPLTTLEAAKLHVLTDYFHVIECGRPVIGGKVRVYKNGPIVTEARDDVRSSWKPVAGTGAGKVNRYHTPSGVSLRDLSPMELDAMDKAVEKLSELSDWVDLTRHFHNSTDSPLGYAWRNAYKLGHPTLDWREVLDAHEKKVGRKLGFIRALIQL